MMIMTTAQEEIESLDFAKRAANRFAKDKKLTTYTDSEISQGCLFAMRWGLCDDCVVVFRLDDSFTPINYQQLIKQVEFE
jgi:hypothetical protein